MAEVSLQTYLLDALRNHPNGTAYSIYRRGWVSFSFIDTIRLSLEIIRQIQLANLNPRDKIAIVLDSCPEYSAVFFGAGLLKIPVVLIDSKISVNEMKDILDHSDAKLLFSGFGMKVAAQELSSKSSLQVPWISIDDLGPVSLSLEETEKEILSFEGLKEEDLALLVYTSGTTSDPKGVMISWGNLVFDGRATAEAIGAHENAIFLSILPMNHLLEFSCGMLTQFRLGAHVVYANTLLPHEIVERLKAFRYTDMIVVPLFLKSLMKSVEKEFQKSRAKTIYLNIALTLSRLIPLTSFRRALFYPVIKKFGFLKRFICGGAALDVAIQEFFTLMGIVVSQGYGLTETSPVSTVAYKGCNALGRVGKAIRGTEVKIADNGEILLRGPHVMMGYYKRPDLTASVIDEEKWFHTGDIGNLDAEGKLQITGRHKELVVMGNGKKVFPDEVEQSIKVSCNIKEFIIVGAQEKTGPLKDTEVLCAVIVPSDELMASHTDEKKLKEVLESEIRKQSDGLAAYKRPSKIFLSRSELPKTSTRKNKRLLIRKMIEEGAYA